MAVMCNLVQMHSVKASVMTQDPDLQIIDRVLAGEQSVYAELVNRYKNYAFTIAFRIVQNKVEAEELAQDAFIKAYHHLKGFQRESRFYNSLEVFLYAKSYHFFPTSSSNSFRYK